MVRLEVGCMKRYTIGQVDGGAYRKGAEDGRWRGWIMYYLCWGEVAEFNRKEVVGRPLFAL